MFSYTPKLYDAVVMILLLILCIIGGAWARGRILLALNIGAVIFAVITAIIMILLILESLNRRVEVQTEWMEAFGKLDDDGKMAVASVFPTVRYHMRRGKPHPYWKDTGVRLELLQLFLETSDRQYISPERNWSSAKMPRKVWQEIKDQLEYDGMVEPDSAAGSHSWKWVGESYKHMLAWWKVGRVIKEDVDIAMSGPTKQYASETERV